MQVADLWVVLHDNGSNVFKKNVTPAEAVILAKMHKDHAKKHPLVDLVVKGQAAAKGADGKLHARTDAEEIARLRTIYQKKTIEQCFPGENPKLPATFEDAFPPVSATSNETLPATNCVDDVLPEPEKTVVAIETVKQEVPAKPATPAAKK